jgi:hypothetical protein
VRRGACGCRCACLPRRRQHIAKLLVASPGISRTSLQGSGNGRGGPGEVFQVPPGPHASSPPCLLDFGSSGYPFTPTDIRGASAVCVCSMRSISFRERDLNVQTWSKSRDAAFYFSPCAPLPLLPGTSIEKQSFEFEIWFRVFGAATYDDGPSCLSTRSTSTGLRLVSWQD